jgi:hypothetical protein
MKNPTAIREQLKRVRADELDRVRLTGPERDANRNAGNYFGPEWGFASLGDPYGANRPGFYGTDK